MDRVLHQVRVKEEQMHRTLDQSASYKTKCGTLQQKLDELVRERSGISEDFARLHEEVSNEDILKCTTVRSNYSNFM